MNKYESYIESGIQGIGEVPINWIVTKFNRYVFFQEGPGLRTFQFTDEGTKVICVTNITEKGIDFTYKKFISNKEYLEKYQHFTVQKGDLLLSSSGNSWGKVSEYLEDEKVMLNTSTIRLNTIDSNRMIKGYIKHILKSEFVRTQLDILMTGSCQPNFGPSHLNQLIIPIPSIGEQQQIVQFLDGKTELIDKLISTKERKITLLKEQRTSLINQVVTKGLNPNVKMKDSGVEWIGEIPEHWEVGKLKHICKENLKSLSNNTHPNYELDYIEISDVDSDGNIKNTTHYTFSESPSRCRRIVSRGDIILSTVRTYLRSIGLIENEVSDLICSTGFSVLTPNYGVYSKHLFYMVRTEWFISMVISKSEGVSYPSIQSEKLMNNLILVVPIDEQYQIVEFLDEKTKEIDDMVQLEQKKIDLLKEYRQSLISEVVTGKIKVTN